MSIQSTGLGDAERGAGLLNSPKWAGHNTFSVDEVACWRLAGEDWQLWQPAGAVNRRGGVSVPF